MKSKWGLAALLVLVALSTPVWVAAQPDSTYLDVTSDAFRDLDKEAWRRQPKSHIQLFIGGINFEGNTGAVIGAQYELRFHRNVGVGVLGQVAFNSDDARDETVTVVAIPLYFHPGGVARVVLAPAWIFPENAESVVTVQFGFIYDFFVNEKWSISPTALFYFREDDFASNLGFSFGLKF